MLFAGWCAVSGHAQAPGPVEQMVVVTGLGRVFGVTVATGNCCTCVFDRQPRDKPGSAGAASVG